MPRIVGNQTLGEGTTPFIGGTRIWRANNSNWSQAATDFLNPGDNVENIYTQTATDIINARDCTISTENIKIDVSPSASNTLGTWNLDNVIIDANDVQHGPNYYTLNWNNVTFQHTVSLNTGTNTFGNWPGTGTAAPYTFNNVNLWPDLLADGATTSLAFFITNGRDSTSLSNVSFWNGQTGDEIRGTALYVGDDIIVDSPLLGPVGFDPSGFGTGFTADALMMARIGNALNGSIIVASPDYRGLEGNSTSVWRLISESDVWWINPLHGNPVGNLQTTTLFPYSGTGATPPTIRVLVGTGVDISSDFAKFINGDVNSAMYTFSATTSTSDLPTEMATDIATNVQAANGLAFLDQNIVNDQTGTAQANWNSGTTFNIVNAPTAKMFRTYSWDRTQWGVENTITPPVSGATDEQVAASRLAGYDHHNGANFTAVTNYDNSDTDDVIVEDYTSPTAAATALNQLGGVTTAKQLGALVKTMVYDNLVAADGATLQPLPYQLGGTTLVFGINNLTLSSTASAYNLTGSTYTIPTGSFTIDADDVVTAISANDITLTGTFTGQPNKASLRATGTLSVNAVIDSVNLRGQSINFNNLATRAGLVLDTPTINNWSASVNHEAVEIDSVTTVNLTNLPSSGNITTAELFGTEMVAGTGNITLNAPSALNVSTADPRMVAGTNVTFVANYTIENSRSGEATGLLSVWRDGVLASGITTNIAAIQPNEVIEVVYTEPGRTDFYQKITAPSGTIIPQTITVTTEANPFPTSTNPATAGTFTPQTPAIDATQMTVVVNNSLTSSADVNNAFQTSLKGHIAYNTFVRNLEETDLLSSAGDSGPAILSDRADWEFTSPGSVILGFTRDGQTGLAVTAYMRTIGVASSSDGAATGDGIGYPTGYSPFTLLIGGVTTNIFPDGTVRPTSGLTEGQLWPDADNPTYIAMFQNNDTGFTAGWYPYATVTITFSDPVAFDPGVTSAQVTLAADDVVTRVQTNTQTSVDALETSLDADIGTINTNVATINTNVDTINTRIGDINGNVSDLETDVGTINTNVGTINTNVGTINTSITSINSTISEIDTTLDETINPNILQVNTNLTGVETKIDTLDTVADGIATIIGDRTDPAAATGDDISVFSTLHDIQNRTIDANTAIGTTNTSLSTVSGNVNTINTNVGTINTNIGTPTTSGDTVFSITEETLGDTDNLRKQKLLGIKPQDVKTT